MLWRNWDKDKPLLGYIMLNPSMANETDNDPTISRCIQRAMNMDFGGICVTNLFALCSTDPKNLYVSDNAIGADNDKVILSACAQTDMVICAWGNHGKLQERGREVKNLLRKKEVDAYYQQFYGQAYTGPN